MTQDPIIIKDWQNGIADSENLGLSLLRNVDIESYPGATRTQKKLSSMTNYTTTTTFTSGTGTGTLTASVSLLPTTTTDDGRSTYNGAAVTVSNSGGALPSPLVAGTVYYAVYLTNNLFGLATTYANAAIGTVIITTTTGTGTQTVTPVLMGALNWMIKDPNSGFIFSQDTSGRIWYTHADNVMVLMGGNSLSSATGNGLVLFRDSNATVASRRTYLLAFRNASIDIADVTNAAAADNPTWTNGWQTSLNTGLRHMALVGQDNIIYWGDGNFVGSIQEIPGSVFLPGTPATYNYNNQALKLPNSEVAYCLEELGVNLLVGGLTFNKIYPWDRSSSSFNLPLLCPEVGIYAMKNSGNTVYVFAGTKGNIYKTTGSTVPLLKTVPGYITNNPGTLQANQITWGGVAVRNSGILFGLSSTADSTFNGVYLLYPDGRLVQDNTPYAGALLPTAILAESDFYRIGYNGGADHSTNSRYAQGTFATVLQSQLYRLGNKINKTKLSRIEVQIARPATTGQIRVSFRRDAISAFTPLATFTADSTTTSWNHDAVATDIENIQFQVEHDGDIELMEVRVYP